MNSNQELIKRFYQAFQKRDYRTMQSCYCEDATFSDPVFPDLNAGQVKAMWQMFCVKGKDLEITFENILETPDGCSADWAARYVFSPTGNHVINRIQARFIIRAGKIIRHDDNFNFYHWARQVLGWKGCLFGWTTWFRKKVSLQAQKSLSAFMVNSANPGQQNP